MQPEVMTSIVFCLWVHGTTLYTLATYNQRWGSFVKVMNQCAAYLTYRRNCYNHKVQDQQWYDRNVPLMCINHKHNEYTFVWLNFSVRGFFSLYKTTVFSPKKSTSSKSEERWRIFFIISTNDWDIKCKQATLEFKCYVLPLNCVIWSLKLKYYHLQWFKKKKFRKWMITSFQSFCSTI